MEGIADYIRWFLYEPETRGAEITRRSFARARYDASYRVSANFLNWVTKTYDRQLIAKLNAAAREGRYSEDLWKEYTGHTVQELGTEWKTALEKTPVAPARHQRKLEDQHPDRICQRSFPSSIWSPTIFLSVGAITTCVPPTVISIGEP